MTEFIPVLLKKLDEIYVQIERMNGYRFYGSSLLIVYDAYNTNNSIKMKLIDFTHCITRKEMQENQHLMSYPPEKDSLYPDNGFLQGLASLIEILRDIYNQAQLVV